MYDGDVCLIYSATTRTIFQDKKYLLNLKLAKTNFNTISCNASLIEDFGRANVTPKETNIMSNMHCIITDPEEVCLVLRVYVLIGFILKL